MKLAFAVISKDREKQIVDLLESTKGVFDVYCLQDTGSSDGTVKVWEEWCKKNKKECKVAQRTDYPSVTVKGKSVLGDFGMARNDSLNLARESGADFFFWADSDDTIVNAEEIPNLAKQMRATGMKFCLMNYNYAPPTQEGMKPVTQIRERLVDLSSSGLKWVHPVHENLIADEDDMKKMFLTDKVYIQHNRTNEEGIATDRRNKLIMEREIKEKGLDEVDLVMIQHYAYDAYEHKEWDIAIKHYKVWLKRIKDDKMKDNMEVIYSSLDKLCRCYIGSGKYSKAIETAYKMTGMSAVRSDGYLRKAEIYLLTNQPEQAIYYAKEAKKRGIPKTTDSVNEIEYIVSPYQIMADAYARMGNFDKSLKMANEAINLMPSNDQLKAMANQIQQAKFKKEVVEAVFSWKNYLADNGYIEKYQAVINSIPADLHEDQYIKQMITEMGLDYKRKFDRPKMPQKDPLDIVIYCGEAYEAWSPLNLERGGIGGSETMVIELGRELAKLGNRVRVYNTPGEMEGEYDGVKYLPFDKFDTNEQSDILIVWRKPDVFRSMLKAKKQYLWLHDTYYGPFPKRVFYVPDKVIVLSQAHKRIIQEGYGIKDDQFWVTRNGIDPELFPKPMPKRNNHDVYWGSSYDRGLKELLEIWGDVKKEVPDAKLHITYGWNTYDAMMNQRKGTPEGEYMQKQKEILLELMKQDGIIDHGRVDKKAQYKLIAECGIWAYLTWFQEISCITAMLAQALGCIPITTPVAALKETVKFGLKVGDERGAQSKDPSVHKLFKEALTSLLKDDKRQEAMRQNMVNRAIDLFDIRTLAKEWNQEFRK